MIMPARPPGVEHVQPLGLLVAVDRRHERVDDAFDEPLRQTHDQEARVQQRRAGVAEDRGDRGGRVRRDEHEQRPRRCSRAPRATCSARMPTTSTSAPLMKIAMVKAQNAGLKIRPICSLVIWKAAAHRAGDVATNRKDHRRGHERHAAGDEESVLVHLLLRESATADCRLDRPSLREVLDEEQSALSGADEILIAIAINVNDRYLHAAPETPADVDDVAHPLGGPGLPRPVLRTNRRRGAHVRRDRGRCAP